MSETEEQTPEFDPFAAPENQSRRGGTLIAVVALVLALAVGGWNAWLWWQDREGEGAADAVSQSLARLDEAQADLQRTQRAQAARLDTVERLELESGLAQLDDALEQVRSVAGSDRARLESMETTISEIQGLLDRLESRVAAIVVRGESPRQGLELAEVDYLLRSANERLRLYGDARSAAQALALADAQLEAMDDPVYLPVRQSIAAANLALDAVQRADMVALTEGLSSLQARIPGLPFPGEVSIATPAGPAVTEDQGIWARFTGAVSSLVTVRREETDLLLVSLEDKDTVRQALWLQLEAARLALLREDDAAYQSALERAKATLSQYFDSGTDAVSRFSSGLAQLREASLTVVWPDISEPWTRLKSIRETSLPAPAAARPATPATMNTAKEAQQSAADSPGTPQDTNAATEAGPGSALPSEPQPLQQAEQQAESAPATEAETAPETVPEPESPAEPAEQPVEEGDDT